MNAEANPKPAPVFDYSRLQRMLQESGIDALVAHSQRHFFYLSGFNSMEFDIEAHAKNFVVVTAKSIDETTAIIPNWESITLQSMPIWVPNKVYAGQFYIKDSPALDGPLVADKWVALQRIFGDLNLMGSRVAFELDQLPVDFHQQLVMAYPKMDIVDASPILHQMRLLKTAEEISRIKAATLLTESAINEAVSAMTLGMTERELANNIASNIVLGGAQVTYMQLTNGGAAGLLHPTDRPLLNGDVIKADVGALVQGYNSDVGRTFAIGSATDDSRRTYDVAYQALQAGIKSVEVGQPTNEIFKASMDVWAKAGFDHVRRHHVGHGIGLEAHEAPLLTPDNLMPVSANMVLAVEVPYYIYGVGGFAPEDTLVVTEQGVELLSHAPPELPVVGQ
jgi:Xaa-Pro aminopeptidase